MTTIPPELRAFKVVKSYIHVAKAESRAHSAAAKYRGVGPGALEIFTPSFVRCAEENASKSDASRFGMEIQCAQTPSQIVDPFVGGAGVLIVLPRCRELFFEIGSVCVALACLLHP
jgi:hypothetical protein